MRHSGAPKCGLMPPPVPSFTLGGFIGSNAFGSDVQLDSGTGQSITINNIGASGASFQFPFPIESGTSYNVTINVTDPNPMVYTTCFVNNGSGVMGDAPVTNISITTCVSSTAPIP